VTFEAQIGSLQIGANRLLEIVDRRGVRETAEYANQLISYSARIMRQVIDIIPNGTYEAEDCLDDDGIKHRTCSSARAHRHQARQSNR
jgi:N-methylhydantoinase B